MPDSDAIRLRVAGLDDVEAIRGLMKVSIARLQKGFLTPEQIAVSHHFMELDTQLIRDGTYFIAEIGGVLAGCGGWSYRATLYGGDASLVAREPQRLDPATDPARVRAMYTSPDFIRRGVGWAILQASEDAARAAGFTTAELMATLAGVPLYERCGYRTIEAIATDPVDGVSIPLKRMRKAL
ncbi:GNAT family N-acetyltransferase [Asticcacaulis solisilvae]|uniref:GNAT family N-acetyltransferase n=1 Tax=Asticcacaulis solisilvae TaxID=1217274 RepID=UPI003FD6C9AA